MKHTETDGGDQPTVVATATDETDAFSFEYNDDEAIEVSRRERAHELFVEFVYKPALVAWDDRRTVVGGLLFLGYVLMGTVGVLLYPAPVSNQVNRSIAPFTTWEAPLGSTSLGENVLSMIIHATPEMLQMLFAGGVFATGVATVLGTVAGYKGGRVDRIITSFSDAAMSVPGLPLIMVLAVVLQPTRPWVIGILITINYWAALGRSIRSQVLTLREEPYVEASRTMGVSTARIIRKDIIPNLMPFILVNFANAARYVVFASVGLYYLGIMPTGVQNWGLQLDEAYKNAGALVADGNLYLLVFPMVAIMGIALSLILLAQGLDRVFNPRVRTRLAGESNADTDDDEDHHTTELVH